MSPDRDSSAPSGPDAPEIELPSLSHVLEHAANQIAARGEIGILSVTVLQRRHVEQGAGWHAYDAIVREIAEFLRDTAARSPKRICCGFGSASGER